MEKDPVCGMSVDPATARYASEHEGKTYDFCVPGCRRAFESDPQKYLAPNYKPAMWQSTAPGSRAAEVTSPVMSRGDVATRRSRADELLRCSDSRWLEQTCRALRRA